VKKLKQSDLDSLHQWFKQYVRSFYSPDPDVHKHILLKEEHTYQVVKHSRALAGDLVLPAEKQHLAEAIALFHDVGRFKQYTVYRTFVDYQSVNHAELGVEILSELPQLETLNAEERSWLTFAIRNHNRMILPHGINGEQQLFANIVRDADKLDIYRVLSSSLMPSGSEGYSAVIMSDLLAGRQSNYIEMKTPDDRKLMRLSWIYDVNYTWTLRRIVERGYIERIIACLPQTPEITAVIGRLRDYINEKLEG
jgi:putative nucleotidyltransferase with HDIG domain